MAVRYKLNRHVCEKDHTGDISANTVERIANLPESQAGPQRHRCAACAYDMGVQDGLKAARSPAVMRQRANLKSVPAHKH